MSVILLDNNIVLVFFVVRAINIYHKPTMSMYYICVYTYDKDYYLTSSVLTALYIEFYFVLAIENVYPLTLNICSLII